MFRTDINSSGNGPIKPRLIFLKRKRCDGALEALCVLPHMSASKSIIAVIIIYNGLQDSRCKIRR